MVDTIVCDAATIQPAQQCDVMHYDTSKMDRYTGLFFLFSLLSVVAFGGALYRKNYNYMIR